MKVPLCNDDTYSWQIAQDEEFADWWAEIPLEVLDRYLKAEKAYNEARYEMRQYVYPTEGKVMETYKHLDLQHTRDAFRSKPNHQLAKWYLQNLMRARHGDQIDDEEYLNGLEEIKAWLSYAGGKQ